MRLLHVADWHLGRRTYREPRSADHDAVIAEMVAVARDSRPDLILHAGDLWDTGRPGHDDLLRGVEALRELSSVAPVLVVCGNHDSPALLRALGRLPGVADHVTFATEPGGPPLAVPLAGGGRLIAAGVPYVHPNRATLPESRGGSGYRGQMRERLATAAADLRQASTDARDRLVLGAHLHIAGALLSSERSVPSAELHAADQGALPDVDYVALGHVHRPQAVGASLARYAGSPIPLDFGEAGEKKSVVLVTAGEGTGARAEPIPLRGGRPLVALDCGLDELTAQASRASGAICRVAIRTGEHVPGLADRVRAALPDATLVEIEERLDEDPVTPHSNGTGDAVDSPLDEMLRDYLASTGTPGPAADRLLQRFGALLSAAEDEASWIPAELSHLEAASPGKGHPERAPQRDPVDASS